MARQVAASMGIETSEPPRRLTIVGKAPLHNSASLNSLQRDSMYARIRDLGSMYQLNWLIRQECLECNGIMECLTDEALCELLRKMDRAVEAIHDGVPFAEVGIVKGASLNWIA